jgi:hypothetical protein
MEDQSTVEYYSTAEKDFLNINVVVQDRAGPRRWCPGQANNLAPLKTNIL